MPPQGHTPCYRALVRDCPAVHWVDLSTNSSPPAEQAGTGSCVAGDVAAQVAHEEDEGGTLLARLDNYLRFLSKTCRLHAFCPTGFYHIPQ